jgi:WD40 repeat protein
MQRIILFFIIIFMAGSKSYSQLYDNKWLTGYDDIRYIEFVSEPPLTELQYTHTTLTSYVDTFVSVSSKSNICSPLGEMLIVANGNGIANNSGLYIESGQHFYDSIAETYAPIGDLVYQQCLLIPKKDNQYYYINSSLTDSTYIQALSSHPDSSYIRFPNRLNIYYSVVDMDKNGGLGKVTSKKNELFHDSRIADGLLTAVRHANGRDWWVVFAHMDTAKLYTFLFTPEGVKGPLVQDIGLPMKRVYGIGTAVFSPDGDMLAIGTANTKIALLDFDRCTGRYANSRILNYNQSRGTFGLPFGGVSGLAFSSNNQYLYVSGGLHNNVVGQYDLDSSDISASLRIIFQKNDSIDPVEMSIFYMALAPDNKIYISNLGGSNPYLHCITKPNEYDTACRFRTNYLQTTDYGASYCPTNMANYRAKAIPVYTIDAGHDTAICSGDSVQLGIEPFKYLNETGVLDSLLHIVWSTNNEMIQLDTSNKYHPIFKTTKAGKYQVYLSLHDTISKHTCNDRIDTINISVINCDTTIEQPTFVIPTLWNRADGNYTISALPPNSTFEVFNTIGQVIYNNKNYSNNWNTNQVSEAIYIYRLQLTNGKQYKGKIFVY